MGEKTILIVGCGDSPTGRYGRLWDALSRITDVKVIFKTIEDDLVGLDPLERGLVIHDDIANIDFGLVEDRAVAHLLKDRTGAGKSGFLGTNFSELWHNESGQRIVSDIEAHRLYKDYMFPLNYGVRGSGKSMMNALRYKAMFAEVPADHPTRKREPKGPRGKWGKLK